MKTCRPIAAIELPVGIVPGQVPTGRPEITWLDPRELLVDEAYQRAISDKGRKLIEKIVAGFDWRRFKPPTAVWTAQGLEVLDGQHSAIAAATHPEIDAIPVVIVEAEEIATRAGAFVGMNKDRIAMSALELHAAAVVAREEQALAIERAYEPRDTVAVRALTDLVRRVGETLAIEVVRVLADAELTPITSAAIRAVEALLVSPEYADHIEPLRLTRAIVTLGPEAEREAGVFAGTHRVPKWRGLVAVWFQEAKKRRSREALESDSAGGRLQAAPRPSPPIASQLPTRRVIIRRTPDHRASFGDPPPGRSALDQARAKAIADAD